MIHEYPRRAYRNGRDLVRKSRSRIGLHERFSVGDCKISIPYDMRWAFAAGYYYEANVTHWILRLLKAVPNKVFYDVGANYGYYTLLLAPLAEAVYAFEPVSRTRAILERNVVENRLENVHVLPFAAGANIDRREIWIFSSSGNDSLVASHFDHLSTLGTEQIEVRPLDDLIGAAIPPGLVKIDVEGAEKFVLEGAELILAEHRPVVVMEFIEHQFLEAGYTGSPR